MTNEQTTQTSEQASANERGAELPRVEDPRSRTLNAIIGLGLLAALFIAVNVMAGPWLRGLRLDLTQDGLFTLSSGTRQVLRDLSRSEPVRITLFYSRQAATGRPALQAYANRVQELLEEYELASGGMLFVEIIDPKPYSDEEARAMASGIPALPLGSGAGADSIFFGIEAAGPTDLRATIPFLDPAQETFLEYELTKLIVSVRSPLRPIVGVVTGLPLRGQAIQGGTGGPWLIWRELSQRYELRDLGQDFSNIDPAVRALLIAHPKGLSEQALRAIDRAVLAGTPAVVLMDPVCESDRPPGSERNPMMAFQTDRSSHLGDQLQAWGVRLRAGVVAGDLDAAASVQARGVVVPYLPYLRLSGEHFDPDDPVTRQISTMILASAGSLTQLPGATTTFTPLIKTGERAGFVDASRISPMTDPRDLLREFEPTGEPIVLAARVRGPASSAFDDQRSGEIDVLIIADADLLTDQFWLEEVVYAGMAMGYRRVSDNGDLVINAVDHAAGDRALLSLRGRGSSVRPFTRVERLRREAEERLASELESLEARRAEVEEQILISQRGDPEEGLMGQLLLSPEQQARVEQFRDELVATNTRLREVRFELGQEVDRLEAWVKAINIGGGPLLVVLIAVVLAAARAASRSQERRAREG